MTTSEFEASVLAEEEAVGERSVFTTREAPSVAPKGNDRPSDWPEGGPIDLRVHDLPHRSSTTEWWYLNCHVATHGGRQLSLFASFFRILLDQGAASSKPEYAHALSWALVDPSAGKYYADSLVDPCAPAVALEKLERGECGFDPLLKRAAQDMLREGKVPHPDRLMAAAAQISHTKLDLDFGGCGLRKLENGAYALSLTRDTADAACELVFHPLSAPIRHGDDGLVRGAAGEGMFYYFIPKCRVEGQIRVEAEAPVKVAGSGWYDHEFGQSRKDQEQTQASWNWISVQLDNGYQISAYDLFDDVRATGLGRWAIVVDPQGRRHKSVNFRLEPLTHWISTRTFAEYPTSWALEIPEVELSLEVEAAFPAQEFVTIISEPAFWEGRVGVVGEMRGRPVKGLGFVERTGFGAPRALPQLLSAAGEQTRRAVGALLPTRPTEAQARRLIASEAHRHYVEDLDLDQHARTVLAPLREMIDRGGKAWRSFAMLACIDAVGGDSQPFADWAALPELVHTGSLIVDDIEDGSTLRRGGPACHVMHGEAIAINAGNAAYFLGEALLRESRLDGEMKLRLYELYFEALRAAHAGQAADIDGLRGAMPAVVESGAGDLLERRVLCVHRLKSAVPVRSLAMMGAIIGSGTPEQVRRMGDYFEKVGLAFQIMDDVLNLRGFPEGLKTRGEDIFCGKVTMPIAKAMSRLGLRRRRKLWKVLSAKPRDAVTVSGVIDELEACGAISACVEQARELPEHAWRALDPLLKDSRTKLMLRAFGWYVLERNY